jgi:hypothetical protein
MAATTWSSAPDNTNDTTFRAWGSALSAQIAAMGWIQTADSGQINWTTVTRPAGTNTSAGYEIWRMDDALQATTPVYLKIEYGTAAVNTRVALWFTVGGGTDGAGTMSAGSTTRKQAPLAASTATAYNSYISGGTNRLSFHLWTNATAGYHVILCVERTHDGAGADTAVGALVLHGVPNVANQYQQQVYLPAGAATAEASIGSLLPTVGTLSKGGTIGYSPIFLTSGIFLNPSRSFVHVFWANFSSLAGTTVTLQLYGVDHTFRVPAVDGNAANLRGTNSNNQGFLMRYE